MGLGRPMCSAACHLEFSSNDYSSSFSHPPRALSSSTLKQRMLVPLALLKPPVPTAPSRCISVTESIFCFPKEDDPPPASHA